MAQGPERGGLDPDWGSDPMTTAERVAVLDRRLGTRF